MPSESESESESESKFLCDLELEYWTRKTTTTSSSAECFSAQRAIVHKSNSLWLMNPNIYSCRYIPREVALKASLLTRSLWHFFGPDRRSYEGSVEVARESEKCGRKCVPVSSNAN